MQDLLGYLLSFEGYEEKFKLQDVASIGRMDQNINLDVDGIDFRHCTFYFQDNVLSVKDHDSSTGTFVNDKKISSEEMVILFPDDVLRVGNLKVGFEPIEKPEVEKIEASILPSVPIIEEKVVEKIEEKVKIEESITNYSDATMPHILPLEQLRKDNEGNDSKIQNPELDEAFKAFPDPFELTDDGEALPPLESFPLPVVDKIDPIAEINTAIAEDIPPLTPPDPIPLKEIDQMRAGTNSADLSTAPPLPPEATSTSIDVTDLSNTEIRDGFEFSELNTTELENTSANKSFNNSFVTNTVQFTSDKANKAKEKLAGLKGMLSKFGKKKEPVLEPEPTQVSVSVDLDSTGLIDNSKFRKINRERFKEEVLKSGIIFPVRLLALIIDINLTIILGYILIQSGITLDFIAAPIKGIFSFLFGEKFSSFGFYVAIFCLLKVVSNIIFRRSLGQLVSLVFVEKNKKGHLRALGRSFLGFVLGPLMIFDLPGFLSKSTAKEVLLLSRFYSTSHMFSILSSLAFSLITGFFAYYLPVMNASEAKLKNFQFKTVKFTESSDLQDISVSNYFHFIQPTHRKTFLKYPYFKTKKSKKNRKYYPQVRLYYPKKKLYIDFEKVESFNFKNLLKSARSNNPLFASQYPEVNAHLGDGKYDKVKFIEELKKLLKASLELGPSKTLNHILTYGPFVKGYVDLRGSLSATLGSDIEEISFFNVGGRDFLKVKAEDGKFAADKTREEYLVSLDNEKGLIYKFFFENLGSRAGGDISKFYHAFLDNLVWQEGSFSEFNDKAEAYDIIDYFLKPSERAHSSEDHDKIFSFYFKMAKRLVRAKNEKLKKDFIDKHESFLKMITGLNNMEKNKSNSLESKFKPLLSKNLELLDAFKNKKLDFFQIPLKKKVIKKPAPEEPKE